MKLKTFPLKTCLRYPGGKSKATKTLAPWYPENFKEYREPFIGGGSVAFYTTQAYPDIPIWINDLYVPLYNFWVQLRDNGEELSERLKQIKTDASDFGTQDAKDEAHKELFNQTKIDINNQDGLERAVSFFILNKCSFSGLTENSTFSPTASRSNFSFVGIEKLKEFSKLMKNWKITNIDYSEVMNADSMAHRGEKGTEDNVKVELLVTNYPTEKVGPLEDFYDKNPKIQLAFDGCYNYNKLKSEGLVDD